MKTGIIYIIKNTVNKKVYIGQTTTTLRTRFCQHLKNSTLKTRHYKIYNAIKKYGKEKFYIECLERNIPIEELDEREIYYIEKYNSFEKGYNSTKGGDGRTINKEYDEEDICISYKNGVGLQELAERYDVSITTISRCLKKCNVATRLNGNKYNQFDKDKFIKMWENKNITLEYMAKKFNVHPRTLKRNAKRMGLQRKGYPRDIKPQYTIEDYLGE